MATSEALFTQAISAFQAGKLDAAERTLKLVLAQTPKHFGALNVLGVLLASKKQYAES